MKKAQKGFLYILIGLIFCACSDFLEPQNVGNRSEEYYIRLYDESRGLVEHVYGTLGYGFQIEASYLTDEAVHNKQVSALATNGSFLNNNPFDIWAVSYDNLRNLYLYIDKVHSSGIPYFPYSPGRNQIMINRYYGDVHFLKAWIGWELLKVYGGEATDGVIRGYPIINEILANEAYMNQARNTYDECVRQILNDLDTAFVYLPLQYAGTDGDIGATWLGKASGKAVKALKARVLLWAASPAYNPQGSHEKWAAALQVALEAVQADGGLKNLQPYAYNNTNNPDHYWRTRGSIRTAMLEFAHYPGSLFGRGECNPSKNLLDAVPMSNGYPIHAPESGYDPNKPFQGRDLRVVNFFFFNNDSLIRGNQKFWADKLEIYEGGKDYWGGFRSDVGSRTGLYMKKHLNRLNLNPDGAVAGGLRNDFSVYERLGRAELYLNLAEAAMGAGLQPDEDLGYGFSALDCLKKIRERAGIAQGVPDAYLNAMATSPDDFLKLIKNERKIELSFQGLRFFDLRRWKEPLEIINQPIRGVKATKNQDGTFSYHEIEMVETRGYNSNTYYLPLPYDEVVKSNGKLLQNKGWD